MPNGVEKVKVTALLPDFQMMRLELGQVRQFIAALDHFPDNTRVAYSDAGKSERTWYTQPMTGGILEVAEFETPPGITVVAP